MPSFLFLFSQEIHFAAIPPKIDAKQKQAQDIFLFQQPACHFVPGMMHFDTLSAFSFWRALIYLRPLARLDDIFIDIRRWRYPHQPHAETSSRVGHYLFIFTGQLPTEFTVGNTFRWQAWCRRYLLSRFHLMMLFAGFRDFAQPCPALVIISRPSHISAPSR